MKLQGENKIMNLTVIVINLIAAALFLAAFLKDKKTQEQKYRLYLPQISLKLR